MRRRAHKTWEIGGKKQKAARGEKTVGKLDVSQEGEGLGPAWGKS